NGSVTITGGGTGLTYTPAPNYFGPDTFTYTLNGGSIGTVTMTVTGVDDPPVAVNDTVTVGEDAPATAIDVLANDTDIDGGPSSITTITQPTNGTAVITGGGTGISYTPAANFTGADSFTYTLNGGSTATVAITVTAVDDPPTAVDDTVSTLEDNDANFNVLLNDLDLDGGPKMVTSFTQPANGLVTPLPVGFVYHPNANFNGLESFTYTPTAARSARC
ncbi:MAG: tandem-95 repeat protein, partial [Myxococcales bacterium]|nr:tandem-95 repeat protein [Myxococcales bacterium]